MDAATVVAFAIVAAIITIAPGADMALVAHTTLTRGRRAAAMATLGISAGLAVHAVASSVGLSSLLARSATAFTIVKTAGAIYLILLGVAALRSSWSTRQGPTPPPTAARNMFLAGLASNVLNPKIALFYLTLLPQFVEPARGDPLGASLALASIHIGMGVVWLVVFAWIVERAGRIVGGSFRTWLQRATGGVLVLLGARILLDRGASRA